MGIKRVKRSGGKPDALRDTSTNRLVGSVPNPVPPPPPTQPYLVMPAAATAASCININQASSNMGQERLVPAGTGGNLRA